MKAELNEKNIDLNQIIQEIIEDKNLISELIENLNLEDDILRDNSYKVLVLLSLEQPKLIYPYWDKFKNKLLDKDSYHKLQGIIILANLSFHDIEDKFLKIFDVYSNLLKDKSFIVAVNVMEHLGIIAKAKPKLRERITGILLDSVNTTQQPKDLMIGAAINSLDEYIDYIDNKTEIIKFIRKQLNSENPQTRKIAKDFLIRYIH